MDELTLARNPTDAQLVGEDLPTVLVPKYMDEFTVEKNLIGVTFVGKSFPEVKT